MASVESEETVARKAGLLKSAKKSFRQAGRSLRSKLLQGKHKHSGSGGLTNVPASDGLPGVRDAPQDAAARSLAAETGTLPPSRPTGGGPAHTEPAPPPSPRRGPSTTESGSVPVVGSDPDADSERGLRGLLAGGVSAPMMSMAHTSQKVTTDAPGRLDVETALAFKAETCSEGSRLRIGDASNLNGGGISDQHLAGAPEQPVGLNGFVSKKVEPRSDGPIERQRLESSVAFAVGSSLCHVKDSQEAVRQNGPVLGDMEPLNGDSPRTQRARGEEEKLCVSSTAGLCTPTAPAAPIDETALEPPVGWSGGHISERRAAKIEAPLSNAVLRETIPLKDKGFKNVTSFRLNDIGKGTVLQEIGSFALIDLVEGDDDLQEIKSFRLSDLTEDYNLEDIESYKLKDLDDEAIDVVLNEVSEEGNGRPTLQTREVRSFQLCDLAADFDANEGQNNAEEHNPNWASRSIFYPECCLGNLLSHPVDLSGDDRGDDVKNHYDAGEVLRPEATLG